VTPALSVVIATRSGWAPLSRTIDCLAAQTVADRIELVVSAIGGPPSGAPPPAVERLAGHRVVADERAHSVAEAIEAGARAASAPVVAFGEDHAFPVPEWAEALLERHEEDWACVGAVVRNANPGTLVSWADYALGYGVYAEGQAGGEVATAPGHNSSYKRDVLLRYADGLAEALEAEWVFHLRLREAGERICLEPRAVIRHVNFGMLKPFAVVTYRHALVAASVRTRGWSAPKRLVYALGSPLIPAVRLARLLRAMPPALRRAFPKRAAPLLLAGLVIDGVGQGAGFLGATPDDARGSLASLELERLRFVPAAEAAGLP
jgi:hypothetical protein